MTNKTNSLFISAAVAGILSAGQALHSAQASADEPAAPAKVHCVGANQCKGQSACATKASNSCAGQNSCAGKGFVEKTKAECDALAKKNKKIHIES